MQIIHCDRYRSHTHDFIEIGSTPHEEECTQAGQDTHAQKLECTALINQLIRQHGQPPANCEFCIVKNNHDFGTYYEAGIIFPQEPPNLQWQIEDGTISQEEADTLEDANDKIWEYINKCEALPDKWDDDAKAELYRNEHPRYSAKVIQLKTA